MLTKEMKQFLSNYLTNKELSFELISDEDWEKSCGFIVKQIPEVFFAYYMTKKIDDKNIDAFLLNFNDAIKLENVERFISEEDYCNFFKNENIAEIYGQFSKQNINKYKIIYFLIQTEVFLNHNFYNKIEEYNLESVKDILEKNTNFQLLFIFYDSLKNKSLEEIQKIPNLNRIKDFYNQLMDELKMRFYSLSYVNSYFYFQESNFLNNILTLFPNVKYLAFFNPTYNNEFNVYLSNKKETIDFIEKNQLFPKNVFKKSYKKCFYQMVYYNNADIESLVADLNNHSEYFGISSKEELFNAICENQKIFSKNILNMSLSYLIYIKREDLSYEKEVDKVNLFFKSLGSKICTVENIKEFSLSYLKINHFLLKKETLRLLDENGIHEREDLDKVFEIKDTGYLIELMNVTKLFAMIYLEQRCKGEHIEDFFELFKSEGVDDVFCFNNFKELELEEEVGHLLWKYKSDENKDTIEHCLKSNNNTIFQKIFMFYEKFSIINNSSLKETNNHKINKRL